MNKDSPYNIPVDLNYIVGFNSDDVNSQMMDIIEIFNQNINCIDLIIDVILISIDNSLFYKSYTLNEIEKIYELLK